MTRRRDTHYPVQFLGDLQKTDCFLLTYIWGITEPNKRPFCQDAKPGCAEIHQRLSLKKN